MPIKDIKCGYIHIKDNDQPIRCNKPFVKYKVMSPFLNKIAGNFLEKYDNQFPAHDYTNRVLSSNCTFSPSQEGGKGMTHNSYVIFTHSKNEAVAIFSCLYENFPKDIKLHKIEKVDDEENQRPAPDLE
jgi:hypothetical protein